MNGKNPHNAQIYSFRFVGSGCSQRKANTYAGSTVPELQAVIQKKLKNRSGQWSHKVRTKIYTAISLTSAPALFRYLPSGAVRDNPKGNSQPPGICGSQISLDLSDVFVFNMPHACIFFSFHNFL